MACNYGLLSVNYGLLWSIVAYFLGHLAFQVHNKTCPNYIGLNSRTLGLQACRHCLLLGPKVHRYDLAWAIWSTRLKEVGWKVAAEVEPLPDPLPEG